MILFVLVVLLSVLNGVYCETIINTPTNWSTISTSLYSNWAPYLPTIPTSKISIVWTEDTDVPFTYVALDYNDAQSGCSTSIPNPSFPTDALLLGSLNESCRARVKSGIIDLYNRNNITSTSASITAQPTWVQSRWPIPDGGVPSTIDVKLDTRYPVKMYGGNPCNGTLTNSSYICKLNVEGPWDYSAKPGYYLLWTTPGSTGYVISGPHYNWTLTIPVPDQLSTVDTKELIITLFVFNQYSETVECPATGACRTNALSSSLVSLTLQTRSEFNFPKAPPTIHPRLFGNNTEWEVGNLQMDAIPCTNAKAPWGGLTDIRHQWELSLWTGSNCTNSRKPGLQNHTIATKYFNATYGQVDDEEAMRIFFMIRRVRYCHSVFPASACAYPLADINQLAALVIDREFQYFGTWVWQNQGLVYDLGTQAPMRFWCLYMDTFWNDVNSTIRSTIEAKFSMLIDRFNQEFDTRHWALYGGNNWTPYLALPAVYWSLTYYYEDSRAQEVLHRALDIMYLHRDMYKDDGAYVEGVAQYSFMSLDSIVEMNRLLLPALGKASDSMVEHRIALYSQWHINSMASDGLCVDFGDSHDARGWGGLATLNANIWRELLGYEVVTPDPCIARPYWINKYYNNGFTNPWLVPVQTATKNWTNITSQICDKDTQVQLGTASPQIYASIQYGSFRTYLKTPDLTSLSKTEQNYQIFYAFQAKDNSFPHSELDFGTFLWTAYGTRLIADLGYGRVSDWKDRQGYLDGNPKGHNTIFVEEANGPADNNTSQFNFIAGTMSLIKVSGFDAFILDGSAVYGRDQPDGWLETFIRTGISLPGGYLILTDFFRTKDTRGPLKVTNNFYGEWSNDTSCKGNVNANMTWINDNLFSIKPDCNADKTISVSLGFIYGVSLYNNAKFVYDGAVVYPTQFSTDTRQRMRFASQGQISSDLRVFALAAVNRTATTSIALNIISNNSDANHPFFVITVDNMKYRVEFSRPTATDALTIQCISNSSRTSTPPTCQPDVIVQTTSATTGQPTSEGPGTTGSATTGTDGGATTGSGSVTTAGSAGGTTDGMISSGESVKINLMLVFLLIVIEIIML